ncbi:uncharacterized protein LOC132717249 [Ruditapes philippinarum]|uniref:uncharacterized protein LOC132717249 n=1 Tax=Ruditapes philippinarum TaxID=129788 RepID=UPI00295C23AE|nr:uncharacterized protein LOC132717249 [Ruditapes philippinarum]
MSSKPIENVDTDKVGDYLLYLKTNNARTDKALDEAINEQKEFMESFRRYKKFYVDHQSSYYKIKQEKEEKQLSKDSPNLVGRLRKEKEDLAFKNESLLKQNEELKTRLSTLAGHKMQDGNPNITDLSDPFRPTKLAEKFREVYDEEWTRSFEELDVFLKDEMKVIATLRYLMSQVEIFCTRFSEKQIKDIARTCTDEIVNPKVVTDENQTLRCKTPSEMSNGQKETAKKIIHDLRKSVGVLSVRPLVQIFDGWFMCNLRKINKLPPSSRETDAFVAKTFEIVWLMKIQNPQMETQWQSQDEKCDKDKFTFYTKRGDIVSQTVWPAVLLHKNGPLMSKGILQAK